MNIQDTTGICLNLFAKWQMKLLFEVATNLHFGQCTVEEQQQPLLSPQP